MFADSFNIFFFFSFNIFKAYASTDIVRKYIFYNLMAQGNSISISMVFKIWTVNCKMDFFINVNFLTLRVSTCIW